MFEFVVSGLGLSVTCRARFVDWPYWFVGRSGEEEILRHRRRPPVTMERGGGCSCRKQEPARLAWGE